MSCHEYDTKSLPIICQDKQWSVTTLKPPSLTWDEFSLIWLRQLWPLRTWTGDLLGYLAKKHWQQMDTSVPSRPINAWLGWDLGTWRSCQCLWDFCHVPQTMPEWYLCSGRAHYLIEGAPLRYHEEVCLVCNNVQVGGKIPMNTRTQSFPAEH